METKILTFISPITNLEKQIVIFKPKHLDQRVNIIISFDGQIFKTEMQGFNRYDGINIFEYLKNNNLQKSIVILISSMQELPNKYQIRAKELAFQKNKTNSFVKKALETMQPFLKKFEHKNLFGIGFSLSAIQVLSQQKDFDHVLVISPSESIKEINSVTNNCSVYYGQQEYAIKNEEKVLRPISIFKKNNPQVNVIKYLNMKHSFNSWNNHFDHMLKSSIIPFLHFQKLNMKGIGKFIHDGSNISFINQDKHLKIHYNKLASMKNEIAFVKKTTYKNDYKILDEISYIKKYYNAKRKVKLNKNDVINLAKELKLLHKTPPFQKVQKFKYNNEFDNEKFVMSHGDINEKNVLFAEDRAYFIDFEWSMLHSFYWDLASVFYKFGLNEKEKAFFIERYQNKQQRIDNNKIIKMIKYVKKIEKDFLMHNKDYFVTGK